MKLHKLVWRSNQHVHEPLVKWNFITKDMKVHERGEAHEYCAHNTYVVHEPLMKAHDFVTKILMLYSVTLTL